MEIAKLTTVQDVERRLLRAGGAELKQIRAEYSELRKIANKRIKRAQAQGDLLDTEQFMTTTAIMKGENAIVNLAKAYVAVVKFLNRKESTAAGRKQIRTKARETLNKLGFENITDANVKLFGEFMAKWRAAFEQDTTIGKKLLADSDFAAEFFDSFMERVSGDKRKINADEIFKVFKKWLNSQGV